MNLQMKMAEQKVLVDEVKALCAKGAAEITDTELALIEEKNKAIKALDAEIDRFKKIEEIARETASREVPDAANRPTSFAGKSDADTPTIVKAVDIPIEFKSSTPKHFMSVGMSRAEAQQAAYKWGQFIRASVLGNAKAREWCSANGIRIETKAQQENINQYGGFLVPLELENYVIQLREQFGVARKLFHKVPMKSDTASIPRRSGAPTTYWLTDGQSITASQKTFDQVTITANKLAALILYSSELAEDAIIDIGDDLAKEIAWKFSYAEDAAAFLGDGTSTYGGFVGACTALQKAQGNPTTTNTAGLITGPSGTGASWTNFTLTNFNQVQGSLPEFAWTRAQPVWLCSRQFYYTVMVELLAAAGGNRIDTIEAGPDGRQPMFLGSPVVFSQVMPYVAGTTTQVVCLYGAFDLAAEFGDRRETTIAMSDQYAFNTDQIAIRGIERVGINVHDVGGNNAASDAQNPQYSAGSVVAGPVVGLQTYTS